MGTGGKASKYTYVEVFPVLLDGNGELGSGSKRWGSGNCRVCRVLGWGYVAAG